MTTETDTTTTAEATPFSLEGRDWGNDIVPALAGENEDLAAKLTELGGFDKMIERATAEAKEPEELDWRAAIAGEDEKFRKQLDRYSDLPSVGQKLLNQEKALSERGEVKIPDADSSEEDLKAWNEKRGVPEEVTGYTELPEPPEGYEVNEQDKAILDKITADLHAAGGLAADPATVRIAHKMFYDTLAEGEAQLEANGAAVAEETSAKLKAEWRGDYKANITFAEAAVGRFFDVAEPQEVLGLRLADGSLLGDNLAFVKAMAQIGRGNADDPLMAETLGKTGGSSKSLEDEKEEIMALRATDKAKYGLPETQQRLDQINSILRGRQKRAA